MSTMESASAKKLPACKNLPVLRRNDKQTQASNDVKFLQKQLNLYRSKDINIDGFFGKKTEDAVKDFQANSGDYSGAIDGIVGPRTWNALGICNL